MAITKERIDGIFEEIKAYRIELAADPTVLGAKYLQDLIATCRNYTNHVARILNELHREKMDLDFTLRRKETAFKIAADELLATNPMVRNLPNISDRQGQINVMLRDEHREIEFLRNDVKDLEHIEKAVRMVHRELKDVMGEIKMQRSLIRDEIDTGRMYGDERNSDVSGGMRAPGAKPDDIDEDEIERMLRGEIPVNGSDAAEAPETSDIADVTVETAESETAEAAPVANEAQDVQPATDTTEVIEEVVIEDALSEPVAVATEPTKAEVSQNKPLTEDEQVIAFLRNSNVTPPSVLAAAPVVSPVVSEQDFSDLFDNL